MKIKYSEQRAKYNGMTTIEIVRSMSDSELKRNAKRGGVAAIAEMERRENVEKVVFSNKPNDIDIGV